VWCHGALGKTPTQLLLTGPGRLSDYRNIPIFTNDAGGGREPRSMSVDRLFFVSH
jgi:hypothetical protein